MPATQYPAASVGLIPYAYDADVDRHSEPDEDSFLFDPTYGERRAWCTTLSWCGVLNIAMLVTVTVSLLALFKSYLIISFCHNDVLAHIATDQLYWSTQSPFQSNARRYPLPFPQDVS
ncbi:uncharacterized protein C8Q71DRAFT_873449 [Rhodofomes roseus]|uniref:Uncharacterized protein n=1 Tax=Rhodofomes roseus TaxID=34475 RepID=A0ABQ8KB00_9APHY|nr:uncharacterized protein C8Q71DRAFT_873449 [Rhodofomes roseus]KAH9834051.1 hypothetical protein C8Q71DRAFT_873449 [Rhodofomes roseus]